MSRNLKMLIKKVLTSRLIFVGIGLGALYWIMHSVFDSIYLHKADFMELVLYPDLNTLLIRSTVIIALLSFCLLVRIDSQIEEKRSSRDSLENIFDLFLDALISVNEDQCIELFNQGAEEIFGYRAEEVLGKPLNILLPERFVEDHRKHIHDLASSLGDSRAPTERGTIIARRKDGSPFPAEVMVWKFELKGEKIFTVIVRDISARKQAEEERERVAADLRRLVDTANAPIFVVDIEGRVKEWNRKMLEITGFAKDEVMGRMLVEEFIEEDYRASFQDVLDKALVGDETSNFEMSLNTKKGERVLLLLGTTTRRDDSGIVVGVVSVGQDITLRKRIEEELVQERKNLEIIVGQRTEVLRHSLSSLEAVNHQLQQADRHKRRFLSTMSHELRTPLNAILGFSDLLKGKHYGPLNEKQSSYVEHIEGSGKHLLALINDLLDIAKIDAGQIEADLEPFSVVAVIDSVTAMMTFKFQEKGLAFEVEMANQLEEPFIGDDKICKQILFNLLSNAAKFTPDGGKVAVRAVVENGFVKVSVSDTGIGIPVDQQEMIFSEFYQADDPSGRLQEGIGIGLALTRRHVELLGGEIWVESEPSKGSTFTFTLPFRRPESTSEKGKPVGEFETGKVNRGLHILVAEDNEVNLVMISDMLAAQGHKVSVARNGQESVALAKSLRPDLILMDIKMPVMDGLSATRQIRQTPEISTVPIIALTASAGQRAIERCLAAGCSGHLAKPVRSQDLFATIEALASISV
ncbi:MAG: PAS domain S-box protein [Candidatus Binatia bacterium]